MSKFRLSPGAQRLSLSLALLCSGAALAPAHAAPANGPFYRAELASPATEARLVSRGVVWTCDGTQCTAARGSSRPLIMCMSLAKDVGPVTRFSAGGKPLEAADLARCNGER